MQIHLRAFTAEQISCIDASNDREYFTFDVQRSSQLYTLIVRYLFFANQLDMRKKFRNIFYDMASMSVPSIGIRT